MLIYLKSTLTTYIYKYCLFDMYVNMFVANDFLKPSRYFRGYLLQTKNQIFSKQAALCYVNVYLFHKNLKRKLGSVT